jgi:predicted N-acetyltransferase YhbS
MTMEIRTVTPNDYAPLDALIREIFTQTEHGYGGEAEIVTKIRESSDYLPELELVALDHDKLVGHGLLSVVSIVNHDQVFDGLVLAPLSVVGPKQGTGIGSKLLMELENRAQQRGYKYISILGHADYYPRFGYLPASRFNVAAPFDVPDEFFMIKPLYDGALAGVSGIVKYSQAFDD